MSFKKFIKKKVLLDKGVWVHETAVIIGDVIIGKESSIWPNVVIRGDANYIRIGEGTNIQDGSVLHPVPKDLYNHQGSPVIIGNNVTIGHRCVIHGCTIKDTSLIGIGSILLDDCIVEQFSIVGAGSVVAMGATIKSGNLYSGNPAIKVRELSDYEKDFIINGSTTYIKLKNDYLKLS